MEVTNYVVKEDGITSDSVVIEEQTLKDAAKEQENRQERTNRNGLESAVVSKSTNLRGRVASESDPSQTNRKLRSSKSATNHTTSSTENGDDLIAARPSSRTAPKSLRLVIVTAYRNRVSGDVYSFNAARRMIIIPSFSSLGDLIEETQKILQKDVHEILININGKLAPLDVKYTLKGMDEIITVTDPPSRSRVPCLRTEFFENLNISYPGHTLLCRRSEVDARDLDFLQKSASKAALLCRNFAHTVPVIEEGTQELRGLAKSRRTGTYSAGSGWEKVRGKILDGNRPFFVYPWKHSFKIDVLVLLSMIIFPLLMGLPIALMKFKAETDNTVESHKLYMYAGMCMLGLTTGLFLNAWLGFYFYIHMSPLSYFCASLIIPGMALVLFKGLTRVAFPFYNAPVCILVMLTAAVLVISYPHIPSRLKAKRKTFRKDISNSTIIINFLVLVFLVNRLLVTNFGQRDAPSLITLSILYPVLVARSTDDCARLAEAFNRKTVAVVEAFFTFVSSVFQMIVFLGIHAKVNPLLVFFLINTTDMFCLFMSGPLAAFLKKKNRRLLKHHSQTAKAEEGEEFSLESFIKWVKDPLKLKPLLIKCYCEVSAKCTFIILSLIIRFGPSSETKGFPFIHDIEESLFFEAVYFTFAELTLWILLQFGVEFYLRKKKCQYMLYKEKRNMQNIKNILGVTNTFITVFLLLQQTPASGA